MKGAIRKGHKPGTWELRVSLGRDPLTGKYGQLSRTFEGGRRDAQTALAELIAEISRDSHIGSPSNALVNDLLAQWLDLVQDRLSPTTMRNYRAYARRYLAPGIGRRSVRKVTTHDIDALYQALSRQRQLSPRTIRQVHAVLRGAFGKRCVGDGSAATRSPVRAHRRSTRPMSIRQVRSGPSTHRGGRRDRPAVRSVPAAGSRDGSPSR